MGQVNAVNSMNASAPNLVGRGSRIPDRNREADGFLIPIMSATPLRPPSRSQRDVSMPILFDTSNHGSARFSAQPIPRSHKVQTLRTSAVIREPRPTSILLRTRFISFPAFAAFHSGASPYHL